MVILNVVFNENSLWMWSFISADIKSRLLFYYLYLYITISIIMIK